MRNTYVWIVVAVVGLFLSLIVAYSLAPADGRVSGDTANAAEKPH